MRYKIAVFALVLFVSLTVGLEMACRFHLFFIEQNQLFLFEGYYFIDMVSTPGGFAKWTAEFLVQFFVLPRAGALITALLLTGVAVQTALICRRMAPAATPLYLLWVLPALSLLCIHFDFNYSYQGTVAFLIMQALLLLYIRLPRSGSRLVAGLVSVPLLFWTCGPVALPYALCVVVWEAAAGNRRWYLAFAVLLEAAAAAWGPLHFALIGEWKTAFTPEFYYADRLIPGEAIWFAWVGLPVVIVCARLCRGLRRVSVKREIIVTATQFAAVAVISAAGAANYFDAKSDRHKMLDHLSRTGQWDAIIEQSKGPIDNYGYLCHLNHALAQKGVLAEDIFKYDQRNEDGLIPPWEIIVPSAILRSDITFCIGIVAASQQMAFEGYVSTKGYGNPRLLQRLVQTNLIYGAWPVAEKYIDILSGTLFYREWADEHRKFLYNDEAVEADPLLGEKRKCLPDENFPVSSSPYSFNLPAIVRQNPANKTAMEYLGSLILLARDLDSFRSLVEENYGTEALPTLPRSFQEAVMVAYDNDPATWKRYGVPDEMIERSKAFQKRWFDNRTKSGLVNIMRGSHGDTYWFYYMLK